MQDNSITSPEPDNDEGSQVKVYANLDSLANEGGTPAIGDEVEVTVRGTVNSIEGSVACISPMEVNGEPAPSAPKTSAPTKDQLRSQAEAADEYA